MISHKAKKHATFKDCEIKIPWWIFWLSDCVSLHRWALFYAQSCFYFNPPVRIFLCTAFTLEVSKLNMDLIAVFRIQNMASLHIFSSGSGIWIFVFNNFWFGWIRIPNFYFQFKTYWRENGFESYFFCWYLRFGSCKELDVMKPEQIILY